MIRSSKIAIISGIIAIILISAALAVHFRLSETEKNEVESGLEQNEKESASQVIDEIVNSIQNKPESENEQNEIGEENESETILPYYVKMIDGVQVVTVNATELKFVPSEIHINSGMTKFVMVNNGVGEHELVVYDASKKEIVDKAELVEDEETIAKNIIFEIDHTSAGQTAESDIIDLKEGSYVIGCHIPGHYEAGMKGTLTVN
ncbi:Hypothetical protein Nlim_0993 [Candidatus Nitrosarchaeum limnium SFB1]|uniref:Blue (type 1) copper domain-containing protein n=1 Tax=Candidatus Nitrosarchaeum limnium SFB1 TaxID=886738 RepID=F3KKH6_9ARCH|nr:Hypothetical protein Nlim_0993 [Candidatus Nitrosarchaeum limnium SFB1]